MARDFAESTLGRLLSFANGRSSPERADGLPYPVYGSNGVIGHAAEANAEANSIVIGRVGSYCGSVHLSPQPCWVTDNAIRATALGDNDPQFLFYLLTSLRLNDWRAGSGQPLLNQDILSRIPAVAPLPDEQRAIAHVLGTLDDKIELNRQMGETLESMARALFRSWFVDFDPVRAKSEGRNPGLPNTLADLFPDSFEDSKVGEIPKGWEVKPLDEIAHFQNGLALQKYRPKDGEEQLPAVKIAQLRSGQADSGEWATEKLKQECVIDDGDIVFSWSGSLLVKVWCGGRAALNQHLFKVTSERYSRWFVLDALLCHLPEFRRIAAGKATTMGHIQRHHLTGALCVVPDEDLLAAADPLFSDFVRRGVANDVERRTLAALRDTLLPRLISGELRIEDSGLLSGCDT